MFYLAIETSETVLQQCALICYISAPAKKTCF